ncbi:MAG: hypothetical protein LBT40_18010, partial [Deltaproteobacteria bacterium]|nr:hypothetical protein [Deltaproteobacteria bacterium]
LSWTRRTGALDREEERSGPGMRMILGPAVVSPAFAREQILLNLGRHLGGGPPERCLPRANPCPAVSGGRPGTDAMF